MELQIMSYSNHMRAVWSGKYEQLNRMAPLDYHKREKMVKKAIKKASKNRKR
jgi:hypothetical protein